MKNILFSLFFAVLFPCMALAQKNANDVSKDANNPLASTKSVSVHNIYSPSVFGFDGKMNTAWIRYAQPIGRVLIRASLPINTVNSDSFDRSGLGDLNVFGTYILTNPTKPNQFGLGPILTLPTATSKSLGAGKWQLGVAIAAYFASNNVFQYGLLATWQHSFAGDSDRRKAHIATIQPFFMWQLGQGLYLRSTGINVMDFENGNYLVPLGLGIGKILKIDQVVCNLFVEPQYALWHKGNALPQTQIFIGINTQF